MEHLITAVSLIGFTLVACFCWALVLIDGPPMIFPKVLWFALLIIICAAIGHHLALLVAISNGISFDVPPILWMDEPFKAIAVLFSTGLAGAGFSFGAYCLLKSVKVFKPSTVDSTN